MSQEEHGNKGLASKALEKGQGPVAESVLANKLLFLWARGLSQHRDLVAIAQAGNWRAQPGNVHKQIMSQFCKPVEIAASFDVWVPCTHPKTNKDALEKVNFFYPT